MAATQMQIDIQAAKGIAKEIREQGVKAKKEVNTLIAELKKVAAHFKGERATRLQKSIDTATDEIKQFHLILARMAALLERNANRFKAFEDAK